MATRLLLDEPGYIVARFRVTTTSRSGEYTTIETGRGRCPSVARDWEDGLLNATYNAVYKHVVKPRGKSDPSVKLLDTAVFYRQQVTRDNVLIRDVRRRDGRVVTTYRNALTGRFVKKPAGRELTEKEIRERF